MPVLILFFLSACLAAAQSLLIQADQAHSESNLAKEQETLAQAAASGPAADRAAAEARLAWLAWRFYKDYPAAERHFDAAEALQAGLSKTLAARSRMLTARGEYEAARKLARRALDASKEAQHMEDARVAFAIATVEEAFETGRSAAASEALEIISEAVHVEPGRFVPSRLMYALAMFLGDTTRIEQALKSHNWGAREPAALYPEAGLAGKPQGAAKYSRFCRRAADIANEHYRLRAIGKSNAPHQELGARILGEARKTWPEYKTDEALFAYLRRTYGTEFSIHNWGVALGHRFLEENLVSEQHGRKANLRVLVLDSMVSNGYITWLTGGRERIGGWASNPVTRVRRDDAFIAWRDMTDPVRKKDFDERVVRARAADDELARKDPYAFFEGLALRLWRRNFEEIAAELRAKGLTRAEFRLAFLDEFERRESACIDAHEARHIIEGETTSGWQREMTGALARVEFSGYPVTGLRSIFAPNIARRDNGSGEGNWHIMQGIVAWMDKHAAEIKGLDRGRPLLPQFDLLTAGQMVECFRSMDPLVVRGS